MSLWTKLTNRLTQGPTQVQAIGFRAVDPASLPTYTADDPAIGLVDKDTGRMLISSSLTVPTTGGLLINRVISAATTNATSVKASAGQVYGWYISNVNAAARFVKLYNKASSPTVGTDTPVITLVIPGNATGSGSNVAFTHGIAFGTGIALAITGVVTDADTTAVAANEIVVNLFYK